MSSLFKKIIKSKKQHLNLLKTLYFNFKVFEFSVAKKIPVFIYGKIGFEGVHRGCVSLTKAKTGCVKIGGGWYTEMVGYSNRFKSYLRIKGKMELGEDVVMLQGVLISISKGAVLRIGNNVRFSERVSIHSKNRIEIGDNTRVGWNSQILDTGFHYMINNGVLKYRNSTVFLDHNVWVANSCSIMRGSFLPAYTVVASNSLVNKNYSEIGEHCMIGGIPAKLITKGVERLLVRESAVDKLFKKPEEVLVYDDIKEELKKEKYHKE